MKTYLLLILIAALLVPGVIIASDISDADFYGDIKTTNNDTAATYVSSNISGLNTPYLITAGYLNSSANNCAIRDIYGNDLAFMPGYLTNPWEMYNGDLSSDTITLTMAYLKGVTGGKFCMFANSLTITDDASMEPTDNYTLKWNDVMITTSTDNIAYKTGAYTLTYSGGNVTYAVTGGDTLTSAVAAGEHDIGARMIGTANTTTETLRPNAGGTYTEITSGAGADPFHWQKVDDITPDDNATYVANFHNVYEKDTYNIPNTSLVSVSGITVYGRFSFDYPSYAKIILLTGGNLYYSSEYSVLGSAWTNLSYTWAVNPNTGIAWTPTDINNLEIGIALKGDGISAFVRCTQVYVVVTGELITNSSYLLIDNYSVDSTTNSMAIPDTANNWITDMDTVPYLGEFIVEHDGVEVCSIDWEYAATFSDDSGNGNDATPVFRTTTSDPDVTSVLSSFGPVKEYIAPAYAVGGGPDWFDSSNITATGNFTTGNVTLDYPGRDIIEAVAAASGTPSQLPGTIISMFVLVCTGLVTGYFLRSQQAASMVLTFTAILVVMGVFVALHIWDWWMLIFWLIFIIPTLHAGKERRES